jgi:gas vesicle protein
MQADRKLEDAMSKGTQWTESLAAFAVGIGIGAAVAVFFAPRSGRETREYLVNSAKDGLDNAVAAGQRVTRRAQDEIENVKDQVNDRVRQVKEQVREVKDQVRQATEAGERAYRESMKTPA